MQMLQNQNLNIQNQNIVNIQIPRLPFFHACDLYTFYDIIKEGKIKTTLCNVFNQELAYLFYGRPAYKQKLSENRGDMNYLPVCFILRDVNISNIYKVLPFDSGAFGRYKNIVHHKMKIDDFEIKFDEIQNFIKCFFMNNENYYTGKFYSNYSGQKDSLWVHEDVRVMQTYELIIKNIFSVEYDDRSRTVEIIVNKDIELNGNIETCIVPDEIMRIKSYQEIFNTQGIKPLSYSVNEGNPPNKYDLTIFHIAKEYLFEKSLLVR